MVIGWNIAKCVWIRFTDTQDSILVNGPLWECSSPSLLALLPKEATPTDFTNFPSEPHTSSPPLPGRIGLNGGWDWGWGSGSWGSVLPRVHGSTQLGQVGHWLVFSTGKAAPTQRHHSRVRCQHPHEYKFHKFTLHVCKGLPTICNIKLVGCIFAGSTLENGAGSQHKPSQHDFKLSNV